MESTRRVRQIILLLSAALFALAFRIPTSYASAARTGAWVSCSKLSSVGLFEQCEKIKILKETGSRVKAYSLPSKTFRNLAQTDVFLVREIQKSDRLTSGSRVLIPAKWLWNSSRKGFQSICKFENSKNEVFVLDCGQANTVKIHRNHILKVETDLGSKISEERAKAPNPHLDDNVLAVAK